MASSDRACLACHATFSPPDALASALAGTLLFTRTVAYLNSPEALQCQLCDAVASHWTSAADASGVLELRARLEPAAPAAGSSPFAGPSSEDGRRPAPRLSVAPQGPHEPNPMAAFYVYVATEDLLKVRSGVRGVLAARPANLRVGSDGAFEWARERLDECVAGHEACRAEGLGCDGGGGGGGDGSGEAELEGLPLRLLDVSGLSWDTCEAGREEEGSGGGSKGGVTGGAVGEVALGSGGEAAESDMDRVESDTSRAEARAGGGADGGAADGAEQTAEKTTPRGFVALRSSTACVAAAGSQPLRFAALSYCWGGVAGMLTTMRSNAAEHSRGIAVTSLPRTIRDGALCAARLGLRYLWVDALCIVQDDEREKQGEIARMAEIFRAAHITIAASSAASASAGFLQPRRDSERPFVLDAANGVRLHLVQAHYQTFLRQMLIPGREPISARAWTAQEGLLSRRQLIYSRLQLFWLCRCRFQGDGGGLDWLDFSNFAVWVRPLVDAPEPDPAAYHARWTEIIANYTGRNLSFAEDRLLAVAAVAAWLHKRTGDRYVAGLWESTLLFDLMWKHSGPNNAKDVAQRNAAGPSWSWVSFAGSAYYVGSLKDRKRDVARILDISTPLRFDFAPFGQVEGCSLTVEAPLQQVRIDERGVYALTSSDACPNVAYFTVDYPETIRSTCKDGEFFCLVLVCRLAGPNNRESPAGLVLHKLQEDWYERVGVFEWFGHGTELAKSAPLRCECHSNGQWQESNRRTLASLLEARRTSVVIK